MPPSGGRKVLESYRAWLTAIGLHSADGCSPRVGWQPGDTQCARVCCACSPFLRCSVDRSLR
eukprot:4049166-Alexandrium_andersonii.AAC.1